MRSLFAFLFLLCGLTFAQAQSNTPAAINGCVYLTTLPTLTNGQQSVFHCDSSGQLLVDDATGVTSVSNGDGTITISPTTGSVIASLALGHANTWTGIQTFTSPVLGAATGTSLALGGATIGSNALAVAGSAIISGNVGIGTTSPDQKLNVAKDVTYSGLGNVGQLALTGATNANERLDLGFDTTSNYGFIEAATVGSGWDNLALQPSGGNVGIGTSGPNYPLDVVGAINTSTAYYAAGVTGVTCPAGTLVVTGISGGIITAATSTGGTCS